MAPYLAVSKFLGLLFAKNGVCYSTWSLIRKTGFVR